MILKRSSIIILRMNSLIKKLIISLVMIFCSQMLFSGSLEDKLFLAIQNHDLAGVKSLIEKGADINYQRQSPCFSGVTPLWEAVNQYQDSIVKYLLIKGANPDLQDDNGWTPLILASMKGSWVSMKYLLKYGARVNIMDKEGKTALMYAATTDYERTLILLEAKADPFSESKEGKTVFDYIDKKIELYCIAYLDKFSKEYKYLLGVLKNKKNIEKRYKEDVPILKKTKKLLLDYIN